MYTMSNIGYLICRLYYNLYVCFFQPICVQFLLVIPCSSFVSAPNTVAISNWEKFGNIMVISGQHLRTV